MNSTTVQFTDWQFNVIKDIKFDERFESNAEVIRMALDYFIEHKYPKYFKKADK